MPASLIVGALVEAGFIAAGGLAAAAITFGVRLVTTYVVASVIAKRNAPDVNAGAGATQAGNRVQLPPNTDNKIPVVYGRAWMKPIIVDAKISTDNKTMWYVMAFSEAMDTDAIGTMGFGDIYWGDKKLTFDGTDLTRVVSWTGSDGVVDTKIDGNLFVYLYRDGSDHPVNTASTAWDILSDSEIAEANRWNNTKKMTKLAFAVVKIKYNQEIGLTGLAEITAEVTNTLTKPGSVIKDYLTNSRYGAGLDDSRIDITALTALDTYSDQTITYTPSGGGASQTMSRYRINGPVDTGKNFLTNIVEMADSCDTWLQWREVENKWSVIPNRLWTETVRQVTNKNIVGGIDIAPIDLNATYNSVTVTYPNTRIKDQAGLYTLSLDDFPNIVRSPNEPDNNLGITLPFTNNVVQAQYIAARRMLQSRDDLTVNWTMDYSGIQIDAGDVIGITHDRYGWGPDYGYPNGKLFRVMQVQEATADDGTLYARITASEYNADVYDDNNIDLQDFIPSLNTGISDPSLVSTPGQVTFSSIVTAASVPSFVASSTLGSTGVTTALEFWYSTSSSFTNPNLYTTEISTVGYYNTGTTVSTKITGLPAGTYYFKTRAVGARRKSNFSVISSALTWTPNPVGTIVGQNFEAHFTPGALSVRQDSSGTYYFADIIPKLYGQSGGEAIEYVAASTDSAINFVNNTWRIGDGTNTSYASITTSSVEINLVPTDSGNYATWSVPTTVTSIVSYMTVPVRYKNNIGEVYQGIPATQQFVVVKDGPDGPSGPRGNTGTNGSTGTAGINGFVPMAYVPTSFDPVTANQTQLNAAWLTAIGRSPVNLDGASFWGPSTHKFYSYYTATNLWTAAAMEIAGDLIATGTIRAAALIGTDVYAINYQSTNATLGSTSSYGTWIKANDGEAYFANTVTIGTNLFVNGLISAGTLKANTVRGDNIVYQTITQEKIAPGVLPIKWVGTTVSTSTVITSSSSTYDWFYSSGLYYGHFKNLGYTWGPVTYAQLSGYTNLYVSFSADLTATGFLSYPNGPIFFLYANYITDQATGYVHGGDTRLFVPASGSPLPSGVPSSNQAGSDIASVKNFYSGVTSYTGPIQLNQVFTIPNGGNLTQSAPITIGVGMLNGNGTPGSTLGVLTFTNVAWSVTL